MIKEKKLNYCLGMLVYSSHYNDRRSNKEETVCFYVCFTMLGLCGQFAISSSEIITFIYSKEAFYSSTLPGFWGLAFSNSLLYMSRDIDVRDYFKKYSAFTFLSAFWKTFSCHKYCKWECDRKYCWEVITKKQYPCRSWTRRLPPPLRQKPWGKIIK